MNFGLELFEMGGDYDKKGFGYQLTFLKMGYTETEEFIPLSFWINTWWRDCGVILFNHEFNFNWKKQKRQRK